MEIAKLKHKLCTPAFSANYLCLSSIVNEADYEMVAHFMYLMDKEPRPLRQLSFCCTMKILFKMIKALSSI